MRVADVMQNKVDYVTVDTPVSEISRIIFGRGINGLPVVKDSKFVGFITERDILNRFFPSIEEYMEDPVNTSDFEKMETKVSEILAYSAKKIMSKNAFSVTPDTPVLKAQSLMLLKKIGRLPVVDKKGNLIGILTKGDIFKAIVGGKLDKEESFYDWMAVFYDKFNDWDKRLSQELPDLLTFFKKEGISKVIDIGSSTGEHAVALAKKGIDVYCLESSRRMQRMARQKKAELPKAISEKIALLEGDFKTKVKDLPHGLECAVFMGDSLSHVLEADPKILKDLSESLSTKKAFLIFQLVNWKKITDTNKGFKDFVMRDIGGGRKLAFLTFYNKNKDLTATRTVFEFNGKSWFFRGMQTKHVAKIDPEKLVEELKKLGFKVKFFGSSDYKLFRQKFDPLTSDWFNLIAKR